MKDLFKLDSYDYDLPESLIAQVPADRRDASRMLVYDEESDSITHHLFSDLSSFLDENTCLVRNNTKVFASRVKAKKAVTGGKAEFFFLKQNTVNGLAQVLIHSNRKKNLGDQFELPGNIKAEIIKREEKTFLVKLTTNDLENYLKTYAQMPIPPYIRSGNSNEDDKDRYQTTYAKTSGSVAAPTAGLHFTDKVFSDLKKKKVEIADLTLHVGLGTFQTIKEEDIRNHHMHDELFYMAKDEFEKTRSKKRIAVGTTSLRVLESFWKNKELNTDTWNSTDIFLYPGVEVASIHGLLTNFHLPKSSLLMLVSAIIGRERVMKIYKEAIEHDYRFYSYGDCMLILRKGYRSEV